MPIGASSSAEEVLSSALPAPTPATFQLPLNLYKAKQTYKQWPALLRKSNHRAQIYGLSMQASSFQTGKTGLTGQLPCA